MFSLSSGHSCIHEYKYTELLIYMEYGLMLSVSSSLVDVIAVVILSGEESL